MHMVCGNECMGCGNECPGCDAVSHGYDTEILHWLALFAPKAQPQILLNDSEEAYYLSTAKLLKGCL